MFIEFLKPEIFDAIIIANIVLGLIVAVRRFRKDISGPLPADAPQSIRAAMAADSSGVYSESA